MLDHLHLENLICIDIETVPGFDELTQLPEQLKELYLKKSERLKKEGESDEEQYFNHAGIYAEFGKIICVTLGIFRKEKDDYQLRLKSFCSDNEKKLLQEFCELLNQHYNKHDRFQFCGHNIREFDIPYLSRRLLVHQLQLPALLDISGRKPWEVNMIDTLQLWRFGDVKHYTSLKLLALILGIDSPKDDIEGKDVGRVYWKEKNLQRIVEYCQRDVITVAQLLLRFKGMSLLEKEQIVVAQ
jgi:hypothetical protein